MINEDKDFSLFFMKRGEMSKEQIEEFEASLRLFNNTHMQWVSNTESTTFTAIKPNKCRYRKYKVYERQ